MHVRNVLIRPPFIMFYLTFLLPRARHVLETVGFEVTPFHGQLDGHSYVVVVARKPA